MTEWADTLIIQTERPKLPPEFISEILNIPYDEAINYRHPGTTEFPITDYVVNKYTKAKDIVLDPMCGTGTIVRRSLHLDRDAYGMDVVPDYVKLSNAAIKLEVGLENRVSLSSAIQFNTTNWPTERLPLKLVFFSPPLMNINRGSYPDSVDQVGNLKLGEEDRWLESIRKICANFHSLLAEDGVLAVIWHNQKNDGHILPLTQLGVSTILDIGYKLIDEQVVLFQSNLLRLPEILHVFQKT